MHHKDSILYQLETEITEQPLPVVIQADKWLLSSGFQKAVRRGEVEQALRAGYSFWLADREGFIRRCHVCCAEDCGVAALDVFVKVMAATVSLAWRKRVGEWKIYQHLVQLMCAAVKTRIADEILIQAERAKRHAALRLQLATSNDDTLAAMMLDDSRDIVERCLSAWFLAGMQRFATDNMPNRIGSMDKTIAALRMLDAPAPLIEASVSVISRTQWPLLLFSPIIATEMRKHDLQPRTNATPLTADVGGLPIYAADIFTRAGRACFSELRKAVPTLKPFTVQQVGLAVFYQEGQLIDKTATCPALEAIKQAGEEADFEFTGLAPSEREMLKAWISENMETLNAIRTTRLKACMPVARMEA